MFLDIDYPGVSHSHRLRVEFNISVGRPAVPYDRHGDPGWPAEPPEVEVLKAFVLLNAGLREIDPPNLDAFDDKFLEAARMRGREARADAAEYKRDCRR